MIQLGDLSKLFVPEQTNKMSSQLYLYQLLANKRPNDTFPNVEISLRMFLVLMAANCSRPNSGRSFSKLKLIENRLRTSMSEGRLVGLTLLSIESEILREINIDDIIDEFGICKKGSQSLRVNCKYQCHDDNVSLSKLSMSKFSMST